MVPAIRHNQEAPRITPYMDTSAEHETKEMRALKSEPTSSLLVRSCKITACRRVLACPECPTVGEGDCDSLV